MKFVLPISLLLATFPIFADEVATLRHLVNTTETNLQAQKVLLNAVLSFKKRREAFLQDPTSPVLATALVKSAIVVERQIRTEHLAHLFSTEFLEEVRFFAKVGKKPLSHHVSAAN